MIKTTTRTMLHKTAGEPPPCLQCCHGWHSSTTSHHVTTWPQDYDNNHAHTYSTIRHSSLRFTALRSGEPSPLYMPWPRTLYKSSQSTHLGDPTLIHSFLHYRRALEASLWAARLSALDLLPIPPFLYPHCKNFRPFKRGTHTRSSLKLDVGLRPETI
jgi:hypothetical protein